MNASLLRAETKISVQTFPAQFSRGRNPHHVIRADPLHVMRRVDNPDRGIKSLNLINDGWRQLKVNVIQMHDIRMKILQNSVNLLPRFF